jgi:hypothetical protein
VVAVDSRAVRITAERRSGAEKIADSAAAAEVGTPVARGLDARTTRSPSKRRRSERRREMIRTRRRRRFLRVKTPVWILICTKIFL